MIELLGNPFWKLQQEDRKDLVKFRGLDCFLQIEWMPDKLLASNPLQALKKGVILPALPQRPNRKALHRTVMDRSYIRIFQDLNLLPRSKGSFFKRFFVNGWLVNSFWVEGFEEGHKLLRKVFFVFQYLWLKRTLAFLFIRKVVQIFV